MYFEENMQLIEKMVTLQYSRGHIFGTLVEYIDESSKLAALFQIEVSIVQRLVFLVSLVFLACD